MPKHFTWAAVLSRAGPGGIVATGPRLVAKNPVSPITPAAGIDLAPLEFLSRSVTVRLLYASPTVGDTWKKQIRREGLSSCS